MCDVEGCDYDSEFYDVMHNEVCEDCMNYSIEHENQTAEDFESK